MLSTAFTAVLAASAAPIVPSEGVKDVIFTLVRAGDAVADVETFVERNNCLRRSLPQGLQYDSIAFHDGTIPEDVMAVLNARASGTHFVDARDYDGFVLPEGVPGSTEDLKYKHMVRCTE